MDALSILKKGSLKLELKLERCDHLVEKYTRNSLDRYKDKELTRRLCHTEESGPINKKCSYQPARCWGCLEESNLLKDMYTPYYESGDAEVYSDMMESCFSIVVRKSNKNSLICNNCVVKLRSCIEFKKQITLAQSYLMSSEAYACDAYNESSSTSAREDCTVYGNESSPPFRNHFDATMLHKEPKVLLKGSQLYFNSPRVFLDSDKIVPSVNDDCKSLHFNHDQVVENYLSPSKDVENVVVTPYIPNIRKPLQAPPSHLHSDNVAGPQNTDVPDYLIEDQNHESNTGSEYLPSRNQQQNANGVTLSKDENFFDLVPLVNGFCSCPLCNLAFSCVQERRVHLKSDHPYMLGKYFCEQCGKTLSSRHHLKTHVMNVHVKLRRYACHICEKEFYRRDSCNKHLQRVHSSNLSSNQAINSPQASTVAANENQIYGCANCGAVIHIDNLSFHVCENSIPQQPDESDVVILPDIDDDVIITD